MNWREAGVTVTGACGFIGSHLVEALARAGARVKALTLYDARGAHGWMDDVPAELRGRIRIVPGDVRDAEFVRRLIEPGDTVFHLAALIGIPYSYHAPRSYVDTNVSGTLNVLEAARAAGVRRLLVTSTSEVYGTPRRVPISETDPLHAQSPYAATKIAADKLAESFHLSFGLPVTLVRPFNTYGPRQSPRAVLPTILMQLLSGAPELKLGSLDTTRDLTFVDDTVEGFMRLAACDAAVGQTVNVGTGRQVTIGELAEFACRALGRSVPIRCEPDRVRPEASEVQRLCADTARLRELVGWTPSIPLERGLSVTADWMKPRLGAYEPGRYYV